jgi:iron complex outermembrane receptor protein
MCSKYCLFLLAGLLLPLSVTPVLAQGCQLIIRGQVIDEASNIPLSFVNVLIQELGAGSVTDDEGSFVLPSVCPGEYHLLFSHIGCEPRSLTLSLSQDTSITVRLAHAAVSLDRVVVRGRSNSYDNLPNQSVNRQSIEDNLNENLAGMLRNQTGVNLLQNGSGIAKPVVHGLYGNRLTILNNGIAQSGQQWGNDHAPEIDPLAADKITVLKGANAIEYGNGNLGSVILIEPNKIGRERHLHGRVNYAFESNGRGHNLHAQMQRYTPLMAWRINGTLKKYGDRHSPNYFLRNTGTTEANLSVQLEKSWQDQTFLDIYASSFNTKLGVLRGSHVGNLTDLESAFEQSTPFFTEDSFTYTLAAPRQEVNHHLLKIDLRHYFAPDRSLQVIVAGQLNDRAEFDVRRGGRTDIPALQLRQYTFNTEIKYQQELAGNWTLKIGNQQVVTDNNNDPQTGILPLIPDYRSWRNGLFATLNKTFRRSTLNLGARYDYEGQKVATITRSIPREIERFNNNFHNFGSVVGFQYHLTASHTFTLNSGFATRNPAINERYSFGLHQGVSGIEEGDPDLRTEQAVKTTLEYKWLPSERFSINALFYAQYFQDYIFLNPQNEFRLTIRGAFPVFRYEQADARIYGFDLAAQATLGKAFLGVLKYSFLRGDDTENQIPLVFMPANSLYGSLTYRAQGALRLTPQLRFEQLEVELSNRLVFAQNHLLPEQDFIPPPDAYQLLALAVSSDLTFPNYQFRVFLRANNLLNVRYRDYLNRQRYFADDLGSSITLGIGLKF